MKIARNPSTFVQTLALFIALGVASTPALAQQSGGSANASTELQPPTPAIPRELPSNILATGMALVVAAIVVGVNLIPSKRTHQD